MQLFPTIHGGGNHAATIQYLAGFVMSPGMTIMWPDGVSLHQRKEEVLLLLAIADLLSLETWLVSTLLEHLDEMSDMVVCKCQ
eukprot:scaffold45378_cov18-Prasinocladus_malaysianus.AAC.1